MQANCCTKQNAIYTGPNTWSPTGNVLAIRNDESGWNLLPNSKVLAVDVQVNNNCGTGNLKSTELYDPTTGTWSCGAQTPIQLWVQNDQELGAAVMMYNGKLIQFGGCRQCNRRSTTLPVIPGLRARLLRGLQSGRRSGSDGA